jgi:hypothetical protein
MPGNQSVKKSDLSLVFFLKEMKSFNNDFSISKIIISCVAFIAFRFTVYIKIYKMTEHFQRRSDVGSVLTSEIVGYNVKLSLRNRFE